MTDVKITRVTQKSGRHYYIEDLEERNARGRPKQKWHKLTRVDEGEAALLEALSTFISQATKRQGNISDAITRFLKDWRAAQRPSPAVRAEYERMFGIIGEKLALFNVDQVEPGDILTFLGRFATKMTARRAYKARLSTFFSWCVLQRLRETNPCREIKLKAPPKRQRRIKNVDVWFAIYDRLPEIGQCFADLCFLTTARPTEIRLLDENQIYGGTIHFLPTKTEDSSGATVDWTITPEIEAVLERARTLNKVRALPGKSAPVIQTRDGKHYTTAALRAMWMEARDKAGHPEVTTRDIRPYAMVCAEQQGYDLRAIQQGAGHTTSTTTEGYLDQNRDVVCPIRMRPPVRKT